MKKSAGFTLIELVIVIIILGILGAVAAPRLFNLQGDAYGANLNALRSSISTAATMANVKAQIQGVSGTKEKSEQVEGYKKVNGLDADIEFKFGYPVADDIKGTDNKGILGTLDGFDYNRYKLAKLGEALTITPESIDKAIVPKDADNGVPADKINEDGCVVVYTPPTENGESAKVQAFTGGC